MLFKDNSSSYNGKSLKAIVRDDDTHIIEVNIYYRTVVKYEKNSWGVSVPQYTGTFEPVVNLTKMRLEGAFATGGLGDTYIAGVPVKRKTIKGLQTIADRLDEATILAMTGDKKAEATNIMDHKMTAGTI